MHNRRHDRTDPVRQRITDLTERVRCRFGGIFDYDAKKSVLKK
jgi:hypothetical protein